MKKENKKSIKDKIISKINNEEIKMKPKSYFIMRTVFFIGLVLSLFLLVFFLGSLIIFVLKVNNLFILPGFGFHGIRIIINSFPWYLLFLLVFLIILIEIIGKNFYLVYKKPLIYSLLIIVIIIVSGIFFLDNLSLHKSLARRNNLPIMRNMYQRLSNLDLDDYYLGKVLYKNNNQWTVELEQGEIVDIIINQRIKGFRFLDEIKENDIIIIVGDKQNNIIDVSGIKKINNSKMKYNN